MAVSHKHHHGGALLIFNCSQADVGYFSILLPADYFNIFCSVTRHTCYAVEPSVVNQACSCCVTVHCRLVGSALQMPQTQIGARVATTEPHLDFAVSSDAVTCICDGACQRLLRQHTLACCQHSDHILHQEAPLTIAQGPIGAETMFCLPPNAKHADVS